MPYNILIVEDEFLIGRDTQLTLEDMGHKVEFAMFASDALTMANQHHPDLLVMDLKLEGSENGIELAKKIHQSCDTAMPVIFITGNVDLVSQANLGSVVNYTCLSKPCSERKLRDAIEKLMSK